MSRIRSKDTKPEIIVRRFLFSKGYRYRLHVGKLFGRPDIVLSKLKTVVFVHGCFWHGHQGCRYYVIPKTDTEKWTKKINGNKQRDHENEKKLKADGWMVISIYECDLKKNKIEKSFSKLESRLRRRKKEYV